MHTIGREIRARMTLRSRRSNVYGMTVILNNYFFVS